jgi:perosamine synthetase
MDPNRRYFFPVIGHNFRLTNVAAAILCAQLERLPDILAKREELCEAYDVEIEAIDELSVQQKMDWSTWTPWLASATLNSLKMGSRSELLKRLESKGVETRPFFIPVHQMPPYHDEDISDEDFPVACSVSPIGFNLPTSSKMKPRDARDVMSIVKTSLALSRA